MDIGSGDNFTAGRGEGAQELLGTTGTSRGPERPTSGRSSPTELLPSLVTRWLE